MRKAIGDGSQQNRLTNSRVVCSILLYLCSIDSFLSDSSLSLSFPFFFFFLGKLHILISEISENMKKIILLIN